jgi:hypothetical protein
MIGGIPFEQRTQYNLQLTSKKYVCELYSTLSVAITNQIPSLRMARHHSKHFAEESILHEASKFYKHRISPLIRTVITIIRQRNNLIHDTESVLQDSST